jgi:hypothetical protein
VIWASIDTYADPVIFHFGAQGIGIHKLYAGGSAGVLHSMLQSQLSDAGTSFTCQIRTPALNASDPRARKILGDVYVELSAADDVTITPYLNNYATAQTATTATGTSSRDHYLVNLQETPQVFVYNLGLDISWESAANAQLYVWEFTCWLDTFDRKEWATTDISHQFEGFFIVHRGYIAHNSTADVTLNVYVDGAETPHSSYTIANGGGDYQRTPIMFQPIKGKAIRYEFTSTAAFRLYREDSEILARSWSNVNGGLQPMKF